MCHRPDLGNQFLAHCTLRWSDLSALLCGLASDGDIPYRAREVRDTGIVHVNDQTLNNDAYAPFGGTRASGNGARFGSQSSWDEFTRWRWVTVRDQAHGFPF